MSWTRAILFILILLLCNWLQVWRVWFINGGTYGQRNMVPGVGGCFALSASVNKRPQSWHVATSIKNSESIRQQISSLFCNLSQTILVFKCFADVFWYINYRSNGFCSRIWKKWSTYSLKNKKSSVFQITSFINFLYNNRVQNYW